MSDPLRSGHILEAVVFGLAEGQAILNIFHYRLFTQPAGPVDVTVEELATDLRDKWRLAVVPNLSIAYQALQYQITCYDAREGGQVNPPTPFKIRLGQRSVVSGGLAADAGVVAGDYSPTFVAAGFIKRTKQAGREGRGAIRVGPIAETNTSGNIINPALNALLKDGLQNTLFAEHFVGVSAVSKVVGVLFNKTRFLSLANNIDVPDTFHQVITSVQDRPFSSSQVSRKRLAVLGA